MTEQDLAQILSIPQLKVIVQASAGFQPQIAVIAQQAIRSLNQGRVLDRLWFRLIDDRKTNISDRHYRTLGWALDPLESTLKWDNLAEWLRDRSGLYWLAGKAGSGKSTLMKYLSDHPQRTNLLQEWAGQAELVTLQFFFYGLGRSEQKSQEGVLRSLLFQALEPHRDLTEHACPAMWKEAVITEDKGHDLTMPSISEMQNSLLKLAGTISADKRFCILIDGLDEFEGKHATLAAFLSQLERLPNVKVLVSSRPLPIFVSAFSHVPKMYLQDLTKWDIGSYIDDTILNHPHIAHISQFERRIAKEVAELVTDKASGVFLWVILACQSILAGLEEYDTGPELMKRIMELPPELGDFFRQIIAGIDPRKRDESARLLRLVFESQTSSNFDSIPTLGLAIADEQGLRTDFMEPSIIGLSDEEMVLRCQQMEGRLRSRCSGLVEIQADSAIRLASICMTAEARAVVDSHVVFMHRSLYEFLCTEGMWEWDVLRVDNACGRFEPHAILALLWTQLAGLKQWSGWSFKSICVMNALVHNLNAAATDCPPSILASNLSRLQGLFAIGGLHGPFWEYASIWLPHHPYCRKGYEDLSFGLALAAELGMVSVVRLALEDRDGLRLMLIPPEANRLLDCSSFSICPTRLYQSNRGRDVPKYSSRSTVLPLLYHAICRPSLNFLRKIRLGTSKESNEVPVSKVGSEIPVSMEVVAYLLDQGCDPNEEFYYPNDWGAGISTPWYRWLELIAPGGQGLDNMPIPIITDLDSDFELVHQRAALTMLFVDAGAELGPPGTDMYNTVDESLSEYFFKAAKRSRKTSVERARSNDLWLKVRDKILSLRAVGSHQHECSSQLVQG